MAVDLQYYRSQTPPSLMWRASALTYGRRSPVLPVPDSAVPHTPPSLMWRVSALTYGRRSPVLPVPDSAVSHVESLGLDLWP
ncbi:hypothetical protein RRG08_014615 [Elysia crispata]|uniref:Uncharacterized protein n=1 Tax=Elysia crispata TaxID=231223 RepID=A0AAE0YTD4_9GAST|nr:hypothetical protein RRG08_014615 [Elysia crispata]